LIEVYIELRRIPDHRAVVAHISNTVMVAICLIWVEALPTVIACVSRTVCVSVHSNAVLITYAVAVVIYAVT